MQHAPWIIVATGLLALALVPRLMARVRLSRAKHPSLRGHARISRRVARLIPFYAYDDARFFTCDDAPDEVEERRRAGFERLSRHFTQRSPRSLALTAELADALPDVQFTRAYRVPFQFRRQVSERLPMGVVVDATRGARVRDADGHWAYDLTGSYGVNVFGNDFYKDCIAEGSRLVSELGPFLGRYHPVIADNVRRLRAISGLDEVSFHMSGTEAVMQAVRLARYHTRRKRLVLFCGAYHGWWDGVQPGIGNTRPAPDVFTLREMSHRTLRVLETRSDIACVLVNPLQAMHPNAGAPGDATLIASDRGARFDREAYSEWLRLLREVCSRRNIVLILDEVFVGFRIAARGAQEYFGVQADMVTYGKSLGGGLPVGVVCGRSDLMRRYREDRPTEVCFARGTFNSHPYVMGAMDAFLRRFESAQIQAGFEHLDETWNHRIMNLNRELEARGLPLELVNLSSICTVNYTRPSRYNWMFQYYLRAEGLALSWVGSGRLIFSHSFTDADWHEVERRFIAAARTMDADGWWWRHPRLSNRSIKRQVLRELVSARLRR